MNFGGQNVLFVVSDYRSKKIAFSRSKWQEKVVDHPELRVVSFQDCIKEALSNPD
jgi:hypothetical protein